jgi:hypothetical protein
LRTDFATRATKYYFPRLLRGTLAYCQHMVTKQKQKENANKENKKKTFDEIKQLV